jgi:hypothetical protein
MVDSQQCDEVLDQFGQKPFYMAHEFGDEFSGKKKASLDKNMFQIVLKFRANRTR